MRRPTARGRIVPQSLSTDPRMGRLSLKAALLFPLMWINCDDQGRLSGDPDEIKYAACPNIDHITKEDIPELLLELEAQELIKAYSTSKTKAIQMLDWWQEQKLQWAYPSRYPPPEGWTDHLRYHLKPKEVITENWPPTSELLPSKLPSALPSKLQQREKEAKREIEKETGSKKRNLPSALGSRPPPADKNLAEISKTYEDNIGIITPIAADKLKDIASKYSADWFKDAVAEAVKNNVRRLSYVQSILDRWSVEGKGTARARDRPHRDRKQRTAQELKRAWKGEDNDRDTS